MTPNFALSLSFDGIRLLHRVAGGWALAGDVSLEAPDLAAEMKALRDTAIRLEPDGLRTKLLLPNDQIKFIEIDTTRTSIDDIHAAIDDETPIPLDDLVIDFERTGGRTQIAAVARQTLEEAEGFAKEHGFEPMTFVANAEPLTFSTEVFFGPTKHARAVLGPDVDITRDDSAAVLPVVGTLPGFMSVPDPAIPAPHPVDPEPEQVALPLAEPDDDQPTSEDIKVATDETVSDDAPVDDAEVADDDASEPDLFFRSERPATDTDDTPEPVEDDAAEAAPEVVEEEVSSPVDTPDDDGPADDDDTTADDAPEPVFASRSRTPIAITGARRVPDAVPPVEADKPDNLPTVRPAPSGNPDQSPIAFFARSGSTAKAADADLSTSEPDAPAIPKPLKAADDDAVIAAPVVAPVAVRETPSPNEITSAPRSNPIAPLLAMMKRRKPAEPTKADLALAGTKGKKSDAIVGGKPKHLGLIMTAGLLLFMLIAAMWASSRMENGIAGLFRTPTVPDVAEAPPVVIDAPAIVDVSATTDDAVAAPAEPAPQPVITATTGTVLSPSEAARIYAATGVWQRAPRLPDEARAGNLDGLVSIATQPTISPIPLPDGPDLTISAPDRTILAPTNPIAPDRPVQRDERGFILAAENGTILPTGVWIYGRKPAIVPPVRPGTEPIAAAAVIPVEPDDADTPDATQTVEIDDTATAETDENAAETTEDTPAVAEDQTDGSQPDTSLADTSQADAEQPDEATTETDTIVIAGRPALTPPLRPGSAPPDVTREDGDLLGNDPALAAYRPALRPEGLVPPPPPEPFADPTLAGLRPSVRPADLVPPPEEAADDPDVAEETPATATPDISSIVASIAAAAPPSQIVNPTRNAIAASPRPDSRPRNFSRVVSAAQSLAARQQQRNAAASTAAAAVPAAPAASAPARSSGPTTATVAQAATISNAIRLRDMNLIGVYGRPGNRRALIRLSSGRYVKVEVGSSLDGGRVTAIGDSALNFVKRGQTYALQMPSG